MRNKFLHFCYLNNLVGLCTKTPFSYEDMNLVEPLRINIYNGVTLEQTKKIISYLHKFEQLYFTWIRFLMNIIKETKYIMIEDNEVPKFIIIVPYRNREKELQIFRKSVNNIKEQYPKKLEKDY